MIFIQAVSRFEGKFEGKHIYTALKLQRGLLKEQLPQQYSSERNRAQNLFGKSMVQNLEIFDLRVPFRIKKLDIN